MDLITDIQLLSAVYNRYLCSGQCTKYRLSNQSFMCKSTLIKMTLLVETMLCREEFMVYVSCVIASEMSCLEMSCYEMSSGCLGTFIILCHSVIPKQPNQ